jgi:acyl-CoA synthetase (NDP forming)
LFSYASPKARRIAKPDHLPAWRHLLSQASKPLDEYTSKQILRAYGLPTPTEYPATTLAEALQAAAHIGYPIALKTAAGDLHKSERAGVCLNVRDAAQFSEVYQDFATRLGPQVLVQEMVPLGVELLLGAITDPQFGPMLVLGLGGIFVEVLDDSRLLLLPTEADTIREALRALRGAALLAGVRGRPPIDLDAIVEAALRLADLMEDLGDLIAEIDLNPLIALPQGALVVDALIVPVRKE